MRGTHANTLFLLLTAVALFAAACGPTETVTRSCADGTALNEDGQCQAILSCGVGTAQGDDGACAATNLTPTCGADTSLFDGECVANLAPRVCGSGTTQDGDTCVREVPAVSCGDGTTLEDTVCLSDDPLACGENTVERSTECLAGVCGAGTVKEGSVCVGEDYRAAGGLETFVFRFVRGLCDSAMRCECLDTSNPIFAAAAEDRDVCESLIRGSVFGIALAALNYSVMVEQLEADEEGIQDLMDWVSAAEDCSVNVLEVAEGFPRRLIDLGAMVTAPSVEEGGRCEIHQVCVEGSVCRTPESESEEDPPRVCTLRGGAEAACDAHVHCAETFFCNEGSECQLRPTPSADDPTCNGLTKPCAPGFCCRGGFCTDPSVAGEPCCSGQCLNEALYCKQGDGVSSCQPFPGDGVPCVDDGVCDVGFACNEEGEEEAIELLCRETTSVCQVVDWVGLQLRP